MAGKKTKTPKAPPPPEYPKVYEGFGEPWGVGMLHRPNATNHLTIERYRVTVEKIEEPAEVLRARLVDLWETEVPNWQLTDNFRRWEKQLDFKLDENRRGCRVPKGRAY